MIQKKDYLPYALFLLGGFLIVLFFALPLAWTVSLSLKSVREVFSRDLQFFPSVPQWKNYLFVLENGNILRSIANSGLIVLTTVVFTLLLSLPAAFALSRYRFRSKNLVLLVVLVFQMISPVVVAIPLYRFFVKLGALNSFWSLAATYAAAYAPFATWYLRGYLDTIPHALDEAARIDGCSRLATLVRIHVPMAVPGIVSVVILLSVQSWSQFVIPFILLDDKTRFPVSVALLDLQSTSEAITVHYLAAASIIGVLPVVIIFVVFQKAIISAFTQGAVKG